MNAPVAGCPWLPSSCEVSSALVRATETVGLDRIRLILVSTRRLTSDRRRKDHSRVAFLRGESRVSLTVARSRQSPRLHEDRLHPYQAQTKTTQATEYAMYRQRLPARHTLAGATIRQRFAARTAFKLPHSCDASNTAPPRLPDPKATRSCSSLLQLRLWIAQMGRYQRGGRGCVSANIERGFSNRSRTHTAASPFPIKCVSKCTT